MFGVAPIRIVEYALPLAGTVTSAGLNDTPRPVGRTVADSLTSPENPLKLFTVAADVLLDPGRIVTDAGPESMPKLGAAAGKTVINTVIA